MEIEYKVDGHIASLTINRPEKMNAMTDAMYAAVGQAFVAAENDDHVRCMIVTGAGDRAFSAGHDLLELNEPGRGGGWRPFRPRRFDTGLPCSKPMVAAINGYCLAGGMELALACDIRIAAEHAQFGAPEVKWAILHGYGALRLPDMIGMSNALFLLLTGEFIDAHTALRMGLVSHVVPKEELAETVRSIAERICANGPVAVQMTKELAYRGREVSLEDGLRLYQEYSRAVYASQDAREGTSAFAERRRPNFTGR